MTIALARNARKVIAVEINPEHIEQAKINAKIAHVESKIVFILGDILDNKVLNRIGNIDGAFLDPDWAAVENEKSTHVSKLSNMQPPGDRLFAKIFKKTKNVCLRLPKEIDLANLQELPPHELEKIYLDKDFKFYCAYFGKLAK